LRKGFYLSELKILNRQKTIFDIKFFDENQDVANKLFSTVIIGANGAGKSYLLSLLTEIFRALESKKYNRDFTLRYEYYSIKYYLNDIAYYIEIFKKRFKIYKNRSLVRIDEVDLPLKTLAVSFMINDKFTFQSDDKNPDSSYKYLGVRRTSNATWTNSIVRKVSDALIEHANTGGFYNKVKYVLEFLGYKPKIKLVFEPETKTFFKRGISYEQLITKISKINNAEEYRSFSINKFREEEIDNLMEFINVTSKRREKINVNNKFGIQYTIDFSTIDGIIDLQQDYKVIQNLVDMRLLKSPALLLAKDDEFEFENASSGEKQFLFTMLSIASKIEQNSLVLIDEPELSFHPNWQMLYINYIKRIFNDYPTCHFILATHSHYIISDLEEGSSSIVIIDNNEKENTRKAELVEYSTYAWSAENILYNIFRVRTTRNYYFEMDLRKLITLVKEKSSDLGEIQRLILKLKTYIFDNSDPINLILEEAETYLKNDKSN
jgi:predicted ATP-binding protein involved in virulence